VKSALGINRLGLIGKLDAMNAQDVKREKLSEDVRRKVVEHYKTEMDKLSSLLGRDLSSWQD